MDMRSWKKVLLQWITECGFMERNYFNIEQSDIDVFYQNYISQHQTTDSGKYKRLGYFLKEFYPSFDINLDDENCISSADYIYVYSLLLHYCCVKNPETLFHQICQKLPEYTQQCIASFFKELLDAEPITKEALRHAIAEVANTQSPPPRLNDSFSVMSVTGSVGGQSASSFSLCESPLKTPRRSAGPHRVSPSTPKSNLIEERTREVYNLRAQLETERYEKGLLEVQIKQNEDKIHNLNYDHKRLLQQIQDLKNEIIVKSSDGSTNRDGEENQVQKRLLKELNQREQEIIKLSDIAITLREEKTLVEEKLIYAEKKIVICMTRIKELDYKVDELSEELEKRNSTIFFLTNRKIELEQFITESRTDSTSHLRPDLNASTDCLDNSYIRNNTNSSNSLSSPENLAASVIDVQLREKEHENHILKEELLNVKRELKSLAKEFKKLTHDFAQPEYETLSLEDEREDGDGDEKEECEENQTVSCEEQFFVFNNCMENISKYHKTEKNKVKQLEETSKSLLQENEELHRKLETLNEQVFELKEKHFIKQRKLEELEESKQEVSDTLEKSQKDFLQLQIEKEALYSNLQSSETLKDTLEKLLKELATKLDVQKKINTELTTQNMDLKYSKTNSQTQIQDLKEELARKTSELEEEIQKLTNQVAEQIEEIYSYQQMEKTLKINNEQIMIQNDLFKQQARETDAHLATMKQELLDKDEQMSNLADQIVAITEKNMKLEENIVRMLEKYEHDNLIKENLKTKEEHIQVLEQNMRKLKDELCKVELLLESKQHECELKIQELQVVKPKIEGILKLFTNYDINDAILENLSELETEIQSLLKENKEIKAKLESLEATKLESSLKIEELELELKEKSEIIKQNSLSLKELFELHKQNLDYEENIESLKQQQASFIAKVQEDLEKKELELQERLKEAAVEYDNSLERVGHELKMEKEQNNNKEIELLLLRAEQNELKKQLSQKVENIAKLQEHCEKLKIYESKVIEYSDVNEKLCQEIETFKQEVSQNACRLLEADKALNEFMDLTRQQDVNKTVLENLQKSLQVKDETILQLEQQLIEQAQQADEIKRLQLDIQDKSSSIRVLQDNLDKLTGDREKILQTLEEKTQQIQKEQQDKIVLLNSLEKATDQLKMIQRDNMTQKLALEQQLAELEDKFDTLTKQNTKLQGDLGERKSELQQRHDEQQQEREKFQQKLSELMQNSGERAKELESLDMALIEIVAIMENNFNLSQETEVKDAIDIFNYQNNVKESGNIQKLRKNLNHIWFIQQKVQKELQDISLKNEEATISLQSFQKSNNDLQFKLNQQEKINLELREQLETEELIVEKRLSQEIKRLEGDLLNLEKVNERLAQENVSIHVKFDDVQQELKESKTLIDKLAEEKLHLQEEIRSKSLALEKLKQEERKLQQTLKEKCLYAEKVTEKSTCFENQFKEKALKLQNLKKFCHELKEKSQKSQQKLSHYQAQHQSQQGEQKKLQEKLQQFQTANESLDLEVTKKNKELLVFSNRNSETSQQLKGVEQQLQITSKKLDEMLTHKLNAETQCAQMLSEKQQLKRDLDFIASQQQSQQEEHSRLNQEIESLKQDKQHLRDEIKETKHSLQVANDNVSQLIQQISSIRLEKEAALEENQLFRKQLEETGKHQSSSETKLKTIVEKSQDFERKLLSAENDLKSLKVQLEKSETSSQKLSMENHKLRETQEISTKRIEKLALKLGDSQARSAKLERDNEKLGKTVEANSSTVEALQREKDLLQSEAKSLKERLSRAERGHEQLAAKVHNLEHLNANLHEIKQKLEASEFDGKIKLNKLEKMRETNEEKIRKLSAALNNAEHDNVKLNLEIGALNSQLQEIKTEHNQEQLQREEDLKQQLQRAQDLSYSYEELNEKLKLDLQQLKEENSGLNDQLSKASLSLDITKQRCEKMACELEQIRADMLIIRQEKSEIELQHESTMQKLTHFESQNTKLLYERKNLVKTLEQRITSLEEELASKTKEVDDLKREIEILKENSETHSSLIQKTHTASLSELQQLQSKLLLADETMQKEQQIIAQLRLDNQILHTKYQESKQRALDAATASEERIKENRLELEGKLEKMKSKMKTLYTEEITKMKTKQEREVALIKSELEVHKTQNVKYEEHTRKLSNQIVRLNDNILEHQKENTMLSTKLKHIMEQQQQHHHECERFKRPSSIHVSTISSSTAPVAAAANNIGTNLAMEDEEGEVFNNTYLTDLKNGRMSELMGRDVCVEELKYRNSLLPPHLRSTYAAQYDHEFPEDDLKDGPHSFDDSMSALLSTTAGGTRKKCTGVTQYKRPGPPTPSKNGARLSFGGNSEPCREILKESFDTNAGSSAVSSSKTPARFTFFASRFSMGNANEKPIIKEEPEMKSKIKQEPAMKSVIKQESDELNLRKALHKKNIKSNRKQTTEVGCTSTPRKSKVHYDQRRLMDQLMTSSPSPSPLSIEHKNIKTKSKITPPDVSLIETPLTIFHKATASHQHTSNSKRMVAIAGGLKRSRRNSSMFGRRLSRRVQEICTPTSGETTSSAMSTPVEEKAKRQTTYTSTTATSGGVGKTAVLQRRLRQRPKRERGARPSFYLRGGIFAKYRTPNKGALQDLKRYKSRKQRLDHFNKGRNIIDSFKQGCQEVGDETICGKAMKDRTYDLKNNNYATFNHNTLAETVVVGKCQLKPKQVEDTFTFGEEVFELHDNDELDYMEDYETDELEYEEDDNDLKYDCPIKKEYSKQELITSQDLEEFDRFVAKSKMKLKKGEIDEDSYQSNGSSQQFEKLLIETESNAPFEVKNINFNVTKSSHSSRSAHSQSSILTHSHSTHSSTSHDRDHFNISTATPHNSPLNHTASGHLSRTIYGGTVIYNHRLPNINTTFVRKSSIYVKNRNKSSGGHHHMNSSCNDDVVLITNQTITFVDIMRMWSQMDSSTRIIVSFAILASFTTLLGLFASFCHKR